MKNFLLIAAALLASTFLFADTAVAGGGKGKSSIAISNTNPTGGRAITVWVLTEAQAEGVNSVEDLRGLPNRNIQAGSLETFNQANGSTVIIAADTAAFNGLPDDTMGSKDSNGLAIVGPFDLETDLTGVTFTNLGPPTFEPALVFDSLSNYL